MDFKNNANVASEAWRVNTLREARHLLFGWRWADCDVSPKQILALGISFYLLPSVATANGTSRDPLGLLLRCLYMYPF